MSLRTRGKGRAVQAVDRRVDPAFRERKKRFRASEEQEGETVNRVRQVQQTRVVHVGGVEAEESSGPEEEVPKRGDRACNEITAHSLQCGRMV